MTGKEIAEICKKYEDCNCCKLNIFGVCERMVYDMEHGTPSDILDILGKDYGGSEDD